MARVFRVTAVARTYTLKNDACLPRGLRQIHCTQHAAGMNPANPSKLVPTEAQRIRLRAKPAAYLAYSI